MCDDKHDCGFPPEQAPLVTIAPRLARLAPGARTFPNLCATQIFPDEESGRQPGDDASVESIEVARVLGLDQRCSDESGSPTKVVAFASTVM
jgi:hypothetical protein